MNMQTPTFEEQEEHFEDNTSDELDEFDDEEYIDDEYDIEEEDE